MHQRAALPLLFVAAIAAVAGHAEAWDSPPMCMATVRDEGAIAWSSSPSVVHQDAASLCSAEDGRRAPPEPMPQSVQPDLESTRQRLSQAAALAAAGHNEDALLHLRDVERALPRIADRIALERAALLLKLDMPREACEAFAIAKQSVDRGIAARGQIGAVRCLIASGDKGAEAALSMLLLRYPLLSDRPELQLELALARERWGNAKGAALLLRRIDLESPVSNAGARARAELARLSATGVRLTALSGRERVERAERLLHDGPIDAAATEVATLQQDRSLNTDVRAQVQLLAARIARLQGHFEQATAAAQLARKAGAAAEDTTSLALPKPAPDPGTPEALALARKVRDIRGTKPVAKLSNAQMRTLFDIAIANRMRPMCDEMIEAMTARKSVVPAMRFDAAIRASGLASDDKLAALLETLLAVPSYQLAGRYYYARALERLGRTQEAQEQFTRVIEQDRTATPYYAMWAKLRRQNEGVQTVAFDASHAAAEPQPELDDETRRTRAVELLTPIAARFGVAYPWLLRAVDLTQVDRFDEAADELNEVYLAWRDASGAPRLRSGLVTLLTGNAPARRAATFAERKGRRALDQHARMALSQAAALLGDPGIGLRFGAYSFDSLPRAYETLVDSAAHAHGLDPNLLLAVMRVESIYNRRIISNVGAVGLMQIMPGTGRRIAARMGIANFDVADLLDPRLNLEFSAWYLASLLERFDGRLPLAIASYNGGPHNVRLWMLRNQPEMPLDAFLERIPFSQTHTYVRRVLTHYAAYRAQQHLSMPRLSVELPPRRVDEMAF